jgi:hypothetical protein
LFGGRPASEAADMPRTLTGRSISVPEPNWKPLIELIGLELVDWFMWMFAIELADGARVHAYKHRTTRRYFHLSEDGRAFAYIPRYSYLEIAAPAAIDEAFFEWEELYPEPDVAALDALENLRYGREGAARPRPPR